MPIYDLDYKGKTYSIESETPLSEQEIDNIFKTDIQGKETTEPEKPKGSFVKSVQQGLSFGTAPILSGYGESLGTALYNKTHGQPLLEDTGKAFKRGVEEFKAEQKEYEKEKPISAIAGEVIGGLPYVGLGAGLKGLTTLQKIAKSAKSGTILGGAYGAGTGLSQTKDKILDPKNAVKGALVGSTIGGLAGGLGAAIPTGIGKLLKKGHKGSVSAYITPKGTQETTIKNIINNPKIQKKAVRGDIGRQSTHLLNKASSRIETLTEDINKVIEEAYKDIPDETIIDLRKTNVLGKMNSSFDEFIKNTHLLPNKVVNKETQEIIKNLRNTFLPGKNVNFADLKRMTSFLKERAKKFKKKDDHTISNMYYQMRGILAEARDQYPEIAKASKLKHDVETAKEILESSLGVKLDNPKNASSAILSNFKDNKGAYIAKKVDEVANILAKDPKTEHLSDISDKMKLAQVSYDLIPPEKDGFFSELIKRPSKTVAGAFETTPQKKAQQLSQRLLKGKIKADDLKVFDLVKGGDFINSFIQNQKAYGGAIPSMANAVKKLQLSRYTIPRLTIMDLIKQKEKQKEGDK